MGVAEARLLQTLPVAKARQTLAVSCKSRICLLVSIQTLVVRRPCVREVGWLVGLGGWVGGVQKSSRFFSKKTAAAVTLGMPTALKAVSAKSGGAVDQVTV